MRVTTFMIFNQLTRSLQGNLEKLSVMNNRLSSGKKIEKPSDDVIAMMKILDYKLSINSNTKYMRNVDEATTQLSFIEGITDSLSDTLIRIKELSLASVSGNANAESRASIAEEVVELRDHLLNLSNTKFRDRYIFSGFRTDIQSFNTVTYSYQGDSGVMNVMIDKNAAMPINVPGSDVFSYTLTSEDIVQLPDGKFIHYIPGAGSTINVEVRDTDDVTVLDSFSFSNYIQMADILGKALQNNNILRIRALLKPFDNALSRVSNVVADIGARLNRLDDHANRLQDSDLALNTVLSNTEDADIAETVSEITKTEIALQALRVSSAQMLSQSLMDFLR